MKKKPPTEETLSTGVALGCWGHPAGNSLPPLNLTPEELRAVLEKLAPKFDELVAALDQPIKKSGPYFNCADCQDTKTILVCGGPDRPCPYCSERY